MLMADLSSEYMYEFYNNNTSGKMCSEKYVIKNFPKDYDSILENTSKLDLPFKQRVYHSIKGIDDIIVCKNINCENPVKFKNTTIGYYVYCSNRCVGSDPDMIKYKELKSLKNYGTKTPSESKEIKEKIIQTNNRRYGGNSPMSSECIREKSKKTLMESHGVCNPSYSNSILEKRIKSFQASDYKKSFEKTSLEKYGVEHPWMDKEIHDKSVKSTKESKIKNAIIIAKSRIPESYSIIEARSMGFGRIIYEMKCPNCNEVFDINASNLYDRTVRSKTEICTICNPFNNKSGMEIQLLNYIRSIYDGEIVENSRSVISPYEMDIYLPELKMAFEFNGLYWHSELHKDISYHKDKTKSCEDKGIKLIHVWEDSWVFKNDIIKSIIGNSIGEISKRFYARKCEVLPVDSKTSKYFLNDNHIQGHSPSSIKLGLYFEGELISLMTFGKCRVVLNQKYKEGNYELIRFVSKRGISVIGGASKIFKHFLSKFNPTEVVSYSDSSIFGGDVYKNLGFSHVSDTGLDYYWVIDNQRKHRYNFRKSKLTSMGYDSNKSEREIMYEDVGSYRIWGCGMKKWIFKS